MYVNEFATTLFLTGLFIMTLPLAGSDVSDVEVPGRDVCTLTRRNLCAPMKRKPSPKEHMGLQNTQTMGGKGECRCYKFRINLIFKNMVQ